MPFIRVPTPECNIWEENPALSLISEFKEFKASEGAKKSSAILKAIFYIYDPKSTLKDSGIDGDKLVTDITANVIKIKDFNWHEYQEIIDTYLKFNISKLESMLLSYEKQITDLNKILDKWVANKDDIGEKSK